MSSPSHSSDTDDALVEAPVSSYVVVKFKTSAVDEATLRNLYGPEHEFSTADPDADRIAASLPPVLNWQQIFETFKGEDSVSFSSLSTTLDFDSLVALSREAQDARNRSREEENVLDLELDEDDLYRRGTAEGRGDAESAPPPPEPYAYFRFDLDTPHEDEEALLNRLIELIKESDDTVATVYLAREAALPPRSRTAYRQPPAVVIRQGYFADSKEGLGIASFQSDFPNADGRKIRLADIEQGWYIDHPELPAIDAVNLLAGENIAISGTYPDAVHAHEVGLHGLMVVGIISARHDGRGVNGIAPGTKEIKLASELVFSKKKKKHVGIITDAITAATAWLRAGDVMLIEAQQVPPQIIDNGVPKSGVNVPVEIRSDIFEAIQTATWREITVIEPLGNNKVPPNGPGGISLDAIRLHEPDGTISNLFAWDSGSILVAAGSNNVKDLSFTRAATSNFSTFTNCFADGDFLWVLDPPSAAYSTGKLTAQQVKDLYDEIDAGGTSSAAAIIAGVALLLQSLVRDAGRYIPSDTLRAILSAKSLSTQSAGGKGDNMGVMPDLVKIMTKYPDLTKISRPWP